MAALLDAGTRVGALTGARGLDLALAAAPLAAAAAVLSALALGLAGLGGSPGALFAAAVALWGAVRWRFAAPDPRPVRQLLDWWGATAAGARAGLGAVGGVFAAQAYFLLRHPGIGDDGVNYHLPAAAGWVAGGHPGQVISYFDDLPTGNYPITDEVLVSWAMGLSQSLIPATLWPLACLGLLGAAAWHGLRSVAVPKVAAALGVCVLVVGPITLTQAVGPNTDLPATAWLVTCAALCAGARRHPGLLAPALVAAGMALGVKTTPAAPALVALGTGAWLVRAHLRSLAPALALAAVAALAVGASWYLRNLVTHGAPLWPLATTAFGDPMPFTLRQIDGRLIDDLGSIGPRAGGYAGQLGGGVVLLAGAVVAALLARRRQVTAAAAVAVLCLLVWSAAPYTGYPRGEVFDFSATNSVRYLLPGLAAAVLALALGAKAGPPARWFCLAALGGAAVWNLERVVALGFPFAPSVLLLAAGALLGAVAALATTRLADPPPPPTAALVAGVALAGALLAVPASGYLDRHLAVDAFADGSARYIASRPSYPDGSQTVWNVGTVNGALAGDRLRHRVRLLPRRERCGALLARIRHDWVVLPQPLANPGIDPPPASRRRQQRLRRCLTRIPPAYQDSVHLVYGP